MQNGDKSLLEYLDNIEQKLDASKTPISLSKVVGEPFEKYLEKSKIFISEDSDKRLHDFKIKLITPFVFIALLSFINLVLFFFAKFAITNLILALIIFILSVSSIILIILLPKKVMTNHFLSYVRIDFYIVRNDVEVVRKFGVAKLSLIITTVTIFFLSVFGAFSPLMNDIIIFDNIILTIQFIFFLIIAFITPLCLTCLFLDLKMYRTYILINDKSYLIYQTYPRIYVEKNDR